VGAETGKADLAFGRRAFPDILQRSVIGGEVSHMKIKRYALTPDESLLGYGLGQVASHA
jgi:hypothetical protein